MSVILVQSKIHPQRNGLLPSSSKDFQTSLLESLNHPLRNLRQDSLTSYPMQWVDEGEC